MQIYQIDYRKDLCEVICTYPWRELRWHSGSVMDCHATAHGLTPAGNGVFTELHVLRKGQ